MKELMKTLKSKYRGHRNYYGVIGNKHLLDSFEHFANGIVFKWLNRRSQRRSYNGAGFRQSLRHYGLEEENIEKIATWKLLSDFASCAEASCVEEPGAGKPHAGICEGAARATGGSTLTAEIKNKLKN